jgi:hypothetical protein
VVVWPRATAKARGLRSRAGALGRVDELGAGDAFLLCVEKAPGDARALWRAAREELGGEALVAPVLLDDAGRPSFATGTVVVRFREPPTEALLRDFVSRHGLRTGERNRYVAEQLSFAVDGAGGEFLPDLVERIAAEPGVRAAWLETVARYERRADPGGA